MQLQPNVLESDNNSPSGKSSVWKWVLAILIIVTFSYKVILADNNPPNEVIIKLHQSYQIDSMADIKSMIYSWEGITEEDPEFPKIEPMRESFKPGKSNTTHYLVVSYSSETNIAEKISELEGRGAVKYAEENLRLEVDPSPNKPSFKSYLYNDGTGLLMDTDVQHLMDIPLQSEVVVAVLDSGLDLDHPAVEDSLWINESEIPGNDIDDDSNGYVDDYYGWDFSGNDPLHKDRGFHGTLVASVICGKYNPDNQFSGVNSSIKIMGIDRGLFFEDMALAIRYAVDMGADVINMSFGTSTESETRAEAVQYAYDNNVVIVAAAGNDGEIATYYPALHDTVLSVGASERSIETGDQFLSSYSSYGTQVDFAIYGGSFLLAVPVEDGEYINDYGTSISSPIVATMVAILKSYDKNITPDEVETTLVGYTKSLENSTLKNTKYGYLDLEAFSERYITTNTTVIRTTHNDDTYYVEVDVVREKESNTLIKTIVRRALKVRYDSNKILSLNEEIF